MPHDALTAVRIRQACRLEVLARKAGNVHPAASFADMTCADFLASADIASPLLAQAETLSVGASIEAAVAATHQAIGRNTNLGIALLIAPLAAVPADVELPRGIADVLQRLNVDDAKAVYRAIRAAAPGGLGTAPDQDVAHEPDRTLKQVMELAAERDLVARQYACNFSDVLNIGRDELLKWWTTNREWETAVVGLHLELLAELGDSLIARKCGMLVAQEAALRARGVLQSGWPHQPEGGAAFEELDLWLRADGNRRNPGATADLVAAVLFAALRDAWILPPDV